MGSKSKKRDMADSWNAKSQREQRRAERASAKRAVRDERADADLGEPAKAGP